MKNCGDQSNGLIHLQTLPCLRIREHCRRGLETSKSASSDPFPPAWPQLLNLPQSISWGQVLRCQSQGGGHSQSNLHRALSFSHTFSGNHKQNSLLGQWWDALGSSIPVVSIPVVSIPVVSIPVVGTFSITIPSPGATLPSHLASLATLWRQQLQNPPKSQVWPREGQGATQRNPHPCPATFFS